MPTVLFIGAGRHQVPSIRRIRDDFDCRVVAIDARADAPGLAAASAAYVADDHDEIVAIARQEDVDGVMTVGSDRAVSVVAAVAEDTGLPSIGRTTARAMTDKTTMRAAFAAAGVPQPAFGTARSAAEADTLAATIGYPLIVKPADAGGQRGIGLVHDRTMLAAAVDAAIAGSRIDTAIVERFHDLPEVNVLAIARAGRVDVISVSDRLRPPGAGFAVATTQRFPAQLAPDTLAAVEKAAIAAVEATGLRDGVAFPQILAGGPDDTYLVEIAARIPGGRMTDIALHGTGVDLLAIVLRTALGEPVPDALALPRRTQPTVVRFMTGPPGHLPVGAVRSVDGIDTARAMPGIVAADSWLVDGEEIRPVRIDGDRKGFVTAVGTTVVEAEQRAAAALAAITVTVA
jgi:biotin carboxylase